MGKGPGRSSEGAARGWLRGWALPSFPLCSYRKLALKNHPLKCKEPWAPKRFRQLAEAYDVLSDRKWGDGSLPRSLGAGGAGRGVKHLCCGQKHAEV